MKELYFWIPSNKLHFAQKYVVELSCTGFNICFICLVCYISAEELENHTRTKSSFLIKESFPKIVQAITLYAGGVTKNHLRFNFILLLV